MILFSFIAQMLYTLFYFHEMRNERRPFMLGLFFAGAVACSLIVRGII